MKKITILAATLIAFASSSVFAAEVTTAAGVPVGTAANGSVGIDTGMAPVEKPAEPVKEKKKAKKKKAKPAEKPAEKKAEPKKIELKKEAPAAATTAPAAPASTTTH